MRDSTKPASRSTRRCLETDGCDSRSFRSISPTDRSDESRRPRMARRLGSATTSNEEFTPDIYTTGYMRVKAYNVEASYLPFRSRGRGAAGLRNGLGTFRAPRSFLTETRR